MTISKALFSSRSEEWATPQDFFNDLTKEFHFTLDPCATFENKKCDFFFSKEIDGLRQSWGHQRVFMNPPYGKEIGRWMAKARGAAGLGALVVCLVHARTDTKWWHEHVEGKAEVRFLKGRLNFSGLGRVPFPSVLVIYRPKEK